MGRTTTWWSLSFPKKERNKLQQSQPPLETSFWFDLVWLAALPASLSSLLETASVWESHIPKVLYRGNTWPEQDERMNDRGKGVQTQSQGLTWHNNAMIIHMSYGERAVPGGYLFKTDNLDTKGDTGKNPWKQLWENKTEKYAETVGMQNRGSERKQSNEEGLATQTYKDLKHLALK